MIMAPFATTCPTDTAFSVTAWNKVLNCGPACDARAGRTIASGFAEAFACTSNAPEPDAAASADLSAAQETEQPPPPAQRDGAVLERRRRAAAAVAVHPRGGEPQRPGRGAAAQVLAAAPPPQRVGPGAALARRCGRA